MKEYKYLMVRDGWDSDNLRDLRIALSEGWEPLRETPMPSSGTVNHPPVCLVVMVREKREEYDE